MFALSEQHFAKNQFRIILAFRLILDLSRRCPALDILPKKIGRLYVLSTIREIRVRAGGEIISAAA